MMYSDGFDKFSRARFKTRKSRLLRVARRQLQIPLFTRDMQM